MDSSISKQAADYLKKKKRHKIYLAVFLCLALMVATGTVAVLRMKGQARNYTKRVLACKLEVHEHTQDCYDSEGKLICGYADYVVHTHNDDCYDQDGKLVCTLPEIEEHKHDESCYTEEKTLICGMEETPGHVHTDECYTVTPGELTCTLEEHTHGEGCYDETGALTCGKEEHTHGPECYSEEQKTLTCGQEEGAGGHTHTEECYTVTKTLTCGKLELHTHDESCFDADGKLICKEIELQAHVHGEDCFETIELTPEEVAAMNAAGETEATETEGTETEATETTEEASTDETATEPTEEEKPASCYDAEGNVICGMEEHTHTESCYDAENNLTCELTEHKHVSRPEEAPVGKTYQDEHVIITASYGPEAHIPEEAELRAYPVTAESDPERYEQRVSEALEHTGQTESAQMLIYNIGFYVGDTELEPQASVAITIQFLDDQGFATGDPITVVHFGEEGTESLAGTQVDENGNVTFISDEF